ncbi:iron reductase [Coniophora puteana RWD-64-598 SS2]|uniref:ferric-chelate reductase (NADPH) n=1 Tax=Coniophora puteana (strain RWD-64-598) TaxID=741705 RepID=A0A5M3M8I0_CONPW|nr:iron reductase [Coniophora puteana RWD-64-598 SS2]EIW75479.1 iron reductase [Coniophora puteana RWD-64-598 SS2]
MAGSTSEPKGPTDSSLRVERFGDYPLELWWSVAIFMFVVGVFNWGSYIHSKLSRSRRSTDIESGAPSPSRGFSIGRIPVMLLNVFRVIAYRWTLDIGKFYSFSVAELFVTAGYIALLYTFEFINTTDLEGVHYDIKYWSNRAALLASSQIPLLAALGTKNSFVTLVTGISYDQLNYMHRVMARAVMSMLWIHAGSEVYSFAPFQEELKEPWLRIGITALTALTVLTVISLRPLRSRFYEFFFYSHMLLVFIFLLGGFFHVKAQHGYYWIWPAFIFWGLDRVVRFARLVIFNHSYFGFKSGSGTMDATAELISDTLVRVRMKRPSHFHWSPGQQAFLIMPSVSKLPFEAHPFTIASIDSSLFQPEQFDENEKSISSLWKEVVFLVNIRGGFTKRLGEVAASNGQMRVFIDGPYGPSPEFGCFDTCVLVAGGSGVSYTLPVLLNIVESARNNVSKCTRVVFIWSIRDASHIQWIEQALIKAVQLAPSSLSLSIRIHVTGSALPTLPEAPQSLSQRQDTDASSEKTQTPGVTPALSLKDQDSVLTLSAVRVESGRPNLKVLIGDEVATTSRRLSVSVCGSDTIARATREAVRFPVSGPLSVLNGGPSVSLHVESFGYA